MEKTSYERLMAAALRFVSYRPRSKKEILDFLKKTLRRHNTSAPLVVDQVMNRLTELGYADDQVFVAWWVDQRTRATPKGVRVIVQELMAKGIVRADAETYLAASGIDEKEKALRVLEKKLRVWSALPKDVHKRKAFDYLYRRGFSSGVIRSIVDGVGAKE